MHRSVIVQCALPNPMSMKNATLLLIAAMLGTATVPAMADSRNKADDQGKARAQLRDGKALSLREIEGRVIPRMRGMEYLGPEYVSYANVYRLKFIDGGRVIFVDVDPRTGEVLRQR